MELITVVGARPQFIKASVVSPELIAAGVTERLIHTGQHYDQMMSDAFFRDLSIPAPTWSLDIGSGPHGAQTGKMLDSVEQILVAERPEALMVYGDTNSTIAGALAAAKLHIPVVHVEAGLRSFNRRMPEEINRVLTDHVSDLLLTPTTSASEQLLSEGIDANKIQYVGDVMFDLSLRTAEQHDLAGVRRGLEAHDDDYILVTVHRAENTDDPDRLAAIVEGISLVARDFAVIWPVHPRSRPLLERFDLPDRVRLIEPVGYVEMQALEAGAAVVATDSGGVQKEAFFHGRPCVTLRDETEWTELIELGWNRLAPPSSASSIAAAVATAAQEIGSEAFPYGRGDAGKKIALELASLVS